MTPAEQLAAQKVPKKPKPKGEPKRYARRFNRLQNCLKELRNGLGLTLDEVGMATGINRATVYNVEKGVGISLPAALKFAKFYGKAVEEIWDTSSIVLPSQVLLPKIEENQSSN